MVNSKRGITRLSFIFIVRVSVLLTLKVFGRCLFWTMSFFIFSSVGVLRCAWHNINMNADANCYAPLGVITAPFSKGENFTSSLFSSRIQIVIWSDNDGSLPVLTTWQHNLMYKQSRHGDYGWWEWGNFLEVIKWNASDCLQRMAWKSDGVNYISLLLTTWSWAELSWDEVGKSVCVIVHVCKQLAGGHHCNYRHEYECNHNKMDPQQTVSDDVEVRVNTSRSMSAHVGAQSVMVICIPWILTFMKLRHWECSRSVWCKTRNLFCVCECVVCSISNHLILHSLWARGPHL